MKKLLAATLILALVLSLTGCCCVSLPTDKLGGLFEKQPDATVPEQTAPVVTEPTAPTVSEDNLYYDCWISHDDYVLPGSDTTYFSRADIKRLSDEEQEIAAQEIYARHGRTFSDPDLQEYFTGRSWYTPGAETELNECEKDNLYLLEVHKKELSGEIRDNRYIRHLSSPNNYAMGDSDRRYLGAADLSNQEHDYLVVIRNEIFARHGYIFGNDNLRTYFYCTDWYQPNPNFSNSSFNKYEKANVTLCDLYERKLEGVRFSSNNPYKRYFKGPNAYILPDSSTQYIYEGDLFNMTREQATLARNEILARNGYTFESEQLLEYFLQCDWYKPDTPPGSTSGLTLSKIENANIETLKAFEDAQGAVGNLSKLNTKLTLKVSADAYTILVPAYWKDYAIYEDMTFCEKFDDKTSYGGLLFSLDLYRSKAEFEDIPCGEVWGTISDSDGNSWYLVAYHPSDVQFTPPYADLYHKMYGEIDRIKGTVQAKPGYTFTPA